MLVLPQFKQPGTYVRYVGDHLIEPSDIEEKARFIRLLERMFPLKYPKTYDALAVDVLQSSMTFFNELEPGRGHIYESYLGVGLGIRIEFYHPQSIRQLELDQRIADIPDSEPTYTLTHDDSPKHAPSSEWWIRPGKQYPAVKIRNVTGELYPGGASIRPETLWVVSKWNYEIIEDVELLDMLNKKKIPWEPITFGGFPKTRVD